ncbi:hypothetical protein JMJ94_17895 [Rhodovulum visakhapatnamense]|uniref:Hemolysin type calcium-binding protein n=1 Tax=Rhodovulum visakhapatnamense TaxID=364297 RepID=A0ABS1RIG4_9RHOB|nr:hypothetical protein [Rhodovulum visakhapatnamense]MBL3571341.1 hypothetical protein [Rhodovulum visakhapatnamense]MBL3579445.1 hypothetical protein [Rhodovulum visakhapatnamense]
MTNLPSPTHRPSLRSVAAPALTPLKSGSVASTAGTSIHYTGAGALDFFEFGSFTWKGTATGIEVAQGTASCDWVDAISNTTAATFSTGTDSDTVYGGWGDETVRLGDDNDVSCGNAGNDLIYGNAGNGTLSAGSGSDTLYGGVGNDTFGVYDSNQTAVVYGDDGWTEALARAKQLAAQGWPGVRVVRGQNGCS